jgi:GDP-6-deoxy-D-talose 4-dehydrogenase
MPVALITGIDGFTGRHLQVELSSAGYDVYGICGSSGAEKTRVSYCNIRDIGALEYIISEVKPDVVFHLAAIAYVPHNDVESIYATNIAGTVNLLAALAQCGHKPNSVLLVSSANIYGNAHSDSISESTSPLPLNDYAVSKLAMEHVARIWSTKLNLTIVRPFNLTGIGQSHLFVVPKIVDHFVRRAEYIELGNLDVIRDFSDVRTVAYCYRRLLETAPERGLSGEAFNTCSGLGHSLQDVLQMMREISGHDMEVRVNPAFVRSNEVKTLIGSRAKLEAAIGAVQDIPLYETLKWMYHAPKSI